MEQPTETKSSKKNRKKLERKKAKKIMNQLLDLKDEPLPLSIPPELFSYLISFLSTAETSIAMAISRTWRIKIKMESNLHQEMDLTSIEVKYPLSYFFNIFPIFHRLSSLAENRLVKVSIDLHYLLEKKDQGFDYKIRFQKFFKDGEFLFRSRNTLKEFSLHLQYKELTIPNLSFHSMVYSISQCLKLYPNLRRINVKGQSTTGFLLQQHSRSSNHQGKIFEFADITGKATLDRYTRDGRFPFPRFIKDQSILEIVKWGNDFVGNKSMVENEALLDLEDRDVLISLGNLILDTLSISRLNLKVLELSRGVQFNPSPIWNLVKQSPNLESIHMRFNVSPRLGDVDIDFGSDYFPPQPQVSNPLPKLKKVFFKCEDLNVDWESFSEWMGNNLEDLTLHEHEGFNSFRKDIFSDPRDLHLVTKVCLDSFRFIQLIGVHCHTSYSIHDDLITQRPFPNLESLTLNDVDYWTYQFFETFSFPKLNKIWLQDGGQGTSDLLFEGDPDCRPFGSAQHSFELLEYILMNCNTLILKSIHFSHQRVLILQDLEINTHVEQFSFPKLERIELNGDDCFVDEVAKWIWNLSSQFPALSTVESLDHVRESFVSKSPLLLAR